MSGGEVRPRFEVFADRSAEEILGRIAARLRAADCRCGGWVKRPYAELEIRTRDKHFWSPRLAIYADPAVAGTNLKCRLQPEPSVWALYLMGWALLAIAAASCATYGCAQLLMDDAPLAALIGLPIVGALTLVLYASALAGQKLGRDQMHVLKAELDRALLDVTNELRGARDSSTLPRVPDR